MLMADAYALTFFFILAAFYSVCLLFIFGKWATLIFATTFTLFVFFHCAIYQGIRLLHELHSKCL